MLRFHPEWPKELDELQIVECGGQGDCFYHVLARILNEAYDLNRPFFSAKFLRSRLSLDLKNEAPEPTKQKAVKEYGAFAADRIAQVGGMHGDDFILENLAMRDPLFISQDLGFVLLVPVAKDRTIVSVVIDDNEKRSKLAFLWVPPGHYQAIARGTQFVFSRNNLPVGLRFLYEGRGVNISFSRSSKT